MSSTNEHISERKSPAEKFAMMVGKAQNGLKQGQGEIPVESHESKLNMSMESMRGSWYGKPVEEVDPLVFEDTFCVISKKYSRHYIYRYSSSHSLYLMGPMSRVRRFAIFVTTNQWFDILIILTILANCGTLAMTTNIYERGFADKQITPDFDYYTDYIEYVFLGIYSLEVILKIISKGFMLHRFSYIRNRWNILDFIVVASGYISICADLMDQSNHEKTENQLEFLRTFRVLRVVKTFSIFPGLRMMINALLSSVVQLLEVMALTVVCLMIFSLFALEVFQGKLRQKCVKIKAGSEDDNLMNQPIAEDSEDRDRLWTEWVSDWKNWKRRDFPDDEPTQCGNSTHTRPCGDGYTCIGLLGENPDYGWTNFDNFFSAMLSTFQLLTLDYWERLYDMVISTYGVWSLLFFIMVIFLGSFYLFNLMLAVVAMSYENEANLQADGPQTYSLRLAAARENSNFSFDSLSKLHIRKLLQYRKRTDEERHTLAKIMKLKDDDDTETNITLGDAILNLLGMRMTLAVLEPDKKPSADKLTEGKKSDEGITDPSDQGTSKQQLAAEPTQSKQATEESQPSGSVSVVEVDANMPSHSYIRLWKYKLLIVFKTYLKPIVNHMMFETFITICIMANTICLAMEHHGMSKELEEWLKIGNHFFMAIFTAECIVKSLALQEEYWHSGWNIFDFIIVVISYLDLTITEMSRGGGSGGGLSVIRSLRLLRVFKLAQSWITMKVLLNIIFSSFGALGNLTCVLFIVIYIFAVMGMQIVGKQYTPKAFDAVDDYDEFPKWHFAHFWYAFMMVFRVLCGEWIEPLWDCLRAHETTIPKGSSGVLAYLKCFGIFLPILIVGNFIVLNLFLALLLNSFDTEELNAQREKELEASGRTENLKNIVGLLLKPQADADSGSDEDDIPIDDSKATKPTEGNVDGTQSSTEQGSASAGKTDKARQPSRTVESPYKTRFKAIGRKVIVQNRKAAADRAIIRVENKRKRHRATHVEQQQFLRNPTLKKNSLDDDLISDKTPTSLHSVDVVIAGDCFPAFCTTLPYCRRRWCHRGGKWTKLRGYCISIVRHPAFEWTILFLIFASSITLCFEDIHLDSKPQLKSALCFLNNFFTGVFFVEMILKWFAIGIWGYFTNFWTILDAFIVTVSMISLYFDVTLDICSQPAATRTGAAANLGALKALRTLRALRPLRAISRWQGMKIIVNALMYAIPQIANVLLVCLLFWLVFSIMGVQFFKGQFFRCVDEEGDPLDPRIVPNKDVCCAKVDTHGYSWVNTVSNYDNVFEGYLSLLQIATFEGWMELMEYSVNAVGVDKQPMLDHQIEYYLFYLVFIIFGSFFTLQLFIGVIIDNFNMLKKKYEGNMLEILLTPSQRNYYIAMKNLGRKRPKKVIKRPSGAFSNFFYEIAVSRKLEVGIFIMIFFNMAVEAFDHYGQSKMAVHILSGLNAFFTIVYVLEAVIKLIGLQMYYFTVPWNVFDLILVLASLMDSFIDGDLSVTLPIPPTMLRVARICRIGRVLRLVKAAQGIRKLIFSLIVSLPALFNIGALLSLITFIYAILGMSLFGKAPKRWSVDDVFNFETFLNSNLMLLRLMTAAGWNEVLDSLTVVEPVCGTFRHIQCGQPGEPECPNRALVVAYIVSYLILTFLIVINLYIAIILENYVEASNEEDVGIVEEDLEMFYVRWSRYDPLATQFIEFGDLPDFLESLDPPLGLEKPNTTAIVMFNLPIARGNKVHCLDILYSLIKYILGAVDETPEFIKFQRQLERKFQKQFPTRKLLDIVSSTRKWKIENLAARTIQRAWRAYIHRKRERERDIQVQGNESGLLK